MGTTTSNELCEARNRAAEFLCRDLPRLREFISRSLGPGPRKQTDTDDIMSTVLRRSDELVAKRGRSITDDELTRIFHTLVKRAIADSARVVSRDRRAERTHREIREHAGCADELPSIPTITDYAVLRMTAEGMNSVQIAASLGIKPGSVRMRFSRIRQYILEQL